MTKYRPLRRQIRSLMYSLPGMISCEELEAFILDYLEGNLPTRKRLIFEWHIRFCRECRDYLKAYKLSIELEKIAMTDSIIDEDVPEDLIAAVIAAKNGDDIPK